MSRITEALVKRDGVIGQAGDLSFGRQVEAVDLTHGGQNGFMPELAEMVSNTAYRKMNLIPILIEAPTGFQRLSNPSKWTQVLRSLVELHVQTIDGLNAGLEVEFISTPVGGAGQQQEDFVNVTEVQSNITMTWPEKYGRPVGTFWRGYITNLMAEAHSKVAGMFNVQQGNGPTDQLMDTCAFTMLFIEPDPTYTRVVQSWLVGNMMPKGTGDITGRRDLTQASEQVTYNISFTGITQYGHGVDQFAQTILEKINIVGANPLNRPAFVTKMEGNIGANPNGDTGAFGDAATNEATEHNFAADIKAARDVEVKPA